MSDTENIQNLINERNNQNKRIEQLVVEIEQLRTELDSKNNIINELEKFMDKDYKELDKYGLGAPAGSAMDEINRINRKLQELKDSDKNA